MERKLIARELCVRGQNGGREGKIKFAALLLFGSRNNETGRWWIYERVFLVMGRPSRNRIIDVECGTSLLWLWNAQDQERIGDSRTRRAKIASNKEDLVRSTPDTVEENSRQKFPPDTPAFSSYFFHSQCHVHYFSTTKSGILNRFEKARAWLASPTISPLLYVF